MLNLLVSKDLRLEKIPSDEFIEKFFRGSKTFKRQKKRLIKRRIHHIMSCQPFNQRIQCPPLDLSLDIIRQIILQIMFQKPRCILRRRHRRRLLNQRRTRRIVPENLLDL
jgi:hypothetical protein